MIVQKMGGGGDSLTLIERYKAARKGGGEFQVCPPQKKIDQKLNKI